jgi:hypothetical protein
MGIVQSALSTVWVRRPIAARKPALRSAAGGAATTDAAPRDPGAEWLRRVRTAGLQSLLVGLAPAPTGPRDMTADFLRQAERKLARLRSEARAAAASGDRKAAGRLARELAVLARQIADAAQDYAVAEAAPDHVTPALARAAARLGAASPARAAAPADAGSLAGAAEAAASDAAQAAAAADGTGTRAPDLTEAAGPSGAAELTVAPPGGVPGGSRGGDETGILGKAHALVESAETLLQAMDRLRRYRPLQPQIPGPAA